MTFMTTMIGEEMQFIPARAGKVLMHFTQPGRRNQTS